MVYNWITFALQHLGFVDFSKLLIWGVDTVSRRTAPTSTVFSLSCKEQRCSSYHIFNFWVFIVLHCCHKILMVIKWTSLCFGLFGFANKPSNNMSEEKSILAQKWRLRSFFKEKWSRWCWVRLFLSVLEQTESTRGLLILSYLEKRQHLWFDILHFEICFTQKKFNVLTSISSSFKIRI